MKVINSITNAIIKNAKDGDTINQLAKKTGFAYSAVYKWVNVLESYNVIYLIRKGNKNIIRLNRNEIHKKFLELNDAVSIIDKDRKFWKLIKDIKLRVRFVRSTAITIWTKGNYITGDFYDRIYFVEVYDKDLEKFKAVLERFNIGYSINAIAKSRPLIYITPRKTFKIMRNNNLPVMPLKELVAWCKKLSLENVLEQLDMLYNLNLKVKYSEIKINI